MTPRRRPALFLAGAHREAAYWAEAWGFRKGEWLYLTQPQMFGLRNVDNGIVFVCGSRPIPEGVVAYLRSAGYDTFVDAHDLDTSHEPRCALALLDTYEH